MFSEAVEFGCLVLKKVLVSYSTIISFLVHGPRDSRYSTLKILPGVCLHEKNGEKKRIVFYTPLAARAYIAQFSIKATQIIQSSAPRLIRLADRAAKRPTTVTVAITAKTLFTTQRVVLMSSLRSVILELEAASLIDGVRLS